MKVSLWMKGLSFPITIECDRFEFDNATKVIKFANPVPKLVMFDWPSLVAITVDEEEAP